METTNIPAATSSGNAKKILVQVVETKTSAILRELDAGTADPEHVAANAMRNLDPHRYFTRILSRRSPAPKQGGVW